MLPWLSSQRLLSPDTLYTDVAINAKPLEAWGKRDDNQYAQYDAQPEKQKREALYTSRFAFGSRFSED